MRYFESDTVSEYLPFGNLIEALRAQFSHPCEVPLRQNHEIPNPLAASGLALSARRFTSLIMPAWMPGRYYGVKIVNIAPGNVGKGLPGLHSSYVLFDGQTGVPLAYFDANMITARRTAAASALAGSFLARPEARHLLVIGAGQVARLLPAAYRAVRNIETVTVWSRRAEAAAALVAVLRADGFQAEVAPSVEKACGEVDIVSAATMSTGPLIKGAWLPPGVHLDLIGGFTPAMREADDACFEGARIFVDTEEALQKSGDLLIPMSHGVVGPDDVRGTLTTLCKGVASGRKNLSERTVFKSVGSAAEDLAAAVLVYENHNNKGRLPAVAS